MRAFNRSQTEAVRRADIGGILEGLDYLGQVPWKINNVVYDVFKTAWEKGVKVGELPSTKNIEDPDPLECYNLPSQMYRDTLY